MNLKAFVSALISAVVAATVAFYIQQFRLNRLQQENEALSAAQAELTQERDSAAESAAARAEELERMEESKAELLKLRGEVAQLRRQSKESEALLQQNAQLRDALAQAAPEKPAEEPESSPEQIYAIQRMNLSKQIALSLHLFAAENEGQLPTELTQASAFWGDSPELRTNNFELLITGPLNEISNPSETILIRDRSTLTRDGQIYRVYGFADGHSETKKQPPEGWEAWEKAHLPPAGQ